MIQATPLIAASPGFGGIEVRRCAETPNRYLLPFLPGLYLFAYRCLELPIQRHRRAAVVLLAIYLLYCGADAWHFSAW